LGRENFPICSAFNPTQIGKKSLSDREKIPIDHEIKPLMASENAILCPYERSYEKGTLIKTAFEESSFVRQRGLGCGEGDGV
jgi:hypothetical protein